MSNEVAAHVVFTETALSSIATVEKQRNDLKSVKTLKSDKYADVLSKARSLVSDVNVATLLASCNVDATAYESIQLNAIMKENHIIEYLTRNVRLNNYISEIFESAVNKRKLDEASFFTREDAEHALNRDYYENKASDVEKQYLVKYATFFDATSVQSKTTLQALVALNIFVFHSNSISRDCYTVNVENELTKRFAEKLRISLVNEASNETTE